MSAYRACTETWDPALSAPTYATVAGVMASAVIISYARRETAPRLTEAAMSHLAMAGIASLVYASFEYAVNAGEVICERALISGMRSGGLLAFGSMALICYMTVRIATRGEILYLGRITMPPLLIVPTVTLLIIVLRLWGAVSEVIRFEEWPGSLDAVALCSSVGAVAAGIYHQSARRRSRITLLAFSSLIVTNTTATAALGLPSDQSWSESQSLVTGAALLLAATMLIALYGCGVIWRATADMLRS